MRDTYFRLLLPLVVGTQLRLEDHFYLNHAFTQSEIDSTINVRPILVYEQYDKDGNASILKLETALYCTKRASLAIEIKRDTFLIWVVLTRSLILAHSHEI